MVAPSLSPYLPSPNISMSAALECWSGRPSTDEEDMVEQVILMNNPDRSELSDPSSPNSHHHHQYSNKKWHRIGRNFAGRIASFKNSLSLDSLSSSSSNNNNNKLIWGSVVLNLTQLYPGSQLPEKLISDIRHHFDTLPISYAHANFDIKDVLLHLRLLDQASSQDNHPAIHIIQHLNNNNNNNNNRSDTEEEGEEETIIFKLTFACANSISWPAVSAGLLDATSCCCDSVQIFDRKGLLLGIALLSVQPGHDKHLQSRVDSAFRSALRRPRNIAGVKLPFGLCGCQEDKYPRNAHDDDDGDDRIVQLGSPLSPSTILVSVDESQTVRSPSGEEIALWVLGADEVDFVERAGSGSFKGCYRGRKVWIKKVRGCERGAAYDVEIRQDLLQLMSCGQRNILRFVGICVEDRNGLCVVTRMMDGGSVHDWIHKGKKMGVREVMRIALDVAKGLMFMNDHGLAYRDLNAQRILLDKQGNACLGDMGVVSSCGNVGEVTEYETAGYRWLAPEIIAGDPESVTETWMSNVYSFGMVVWEMVTGEAAYSSYSPVQAAVGIAASGLRPEIPKDCPQVLRSLMMKCWNNCPSKRPTFSEIISILQKHNNR